VIIAATAFVIILAKRVTHLSLRKFFNEWSNGNDVKREKLELPFILRLLCDIYLLRSHVSHKELGAEQFGGAISKHCPRWTRNKVSETLFSHWRVVKQISASQDASSLVLCWLRRDRRA